MDQFPTGASLSHYRILAELERGGMGVVYRALDVKLNREVALKVLPRELVGKADRKRRFIQEAQSAAALEDPYVAVVHEIDEFDGYVFVAMELIHGRTLRQALDEGGVSVLRAVEIATELAEGLSHAHEMGVVHRDLKPSNVMLTDHGHVKIIDFGLAKLRRPFQRVHSEAETFVRNPTTASGVLVGTASYMSPEQARGLDTGHRSDIFSFGILLYEMLAGDHPFRAPSVPEMLHAIINERHPPLRGAAAVEPIVDRCLEKDPALRYQTADELVGDLRALRLRLGSATSARRTTWQHVTNAAAALMLVAGVFLLPRPSPPETAARSGDTRPSIAVLPFANVSGDPELQWLEEGLAHMLVTDLSQSPSVSVMSAERLHRLSEGLERASPEVSKRVARAGAHATIVGRFMRAGAAIRVDVQVQDAGTGKILASEKVEGAEEASLFSMVDELSRRIRASLDGPSESHGGLDHDLKDVTTASIDAYRLYAEGIHYHLRGRVTDARRLFEKALELDPGFAMAMAKLAVVHHNAGDFAESDRYGALAVEHAYRLTEKERYYVQGLYYARADVSKGRSLESYRKLLELYPDHSASRHNLGLLYYFFERFDECIDTTEELRRRGQAFVGTYEVLAHCHAANGDFDAGVRVLQDFADQNADNPIAQLNLGRLLAHWGRLDEAEDALRRAESLDPGWSSPCESRWILAALREEWDEAHRLASALRSEESAFWSLRGALALAQTELYRGRSHSALALLLDEGVYLRSQAYAAHVQIESGSPREALRKLQSIPPRRGGDLPEWEHIFFTGLAQARLGLGDAARASLRELGRVAGSLPTGREKRRYHHLAGEIALANGDVGEAIEELERARSMLPRRGIIDTPPHNDPQHLPIWYALASAYLQSGDSAGARRWLERIAESEVEHVWWPLFYVRSFYLLGRIHEDAGALAKAKLSYRRFFEFWRGGDLDRDRLQEVEAKLSS